jgi:hypothetical protein
MTNEELLKTLNFREVSDIKHKLADKLESSLITNGFGYRLAKIQLKNENFKINQVYDVEFRLTFVNLVGLTPKDMSRLTKVLVEMSTEVEKVNNEYKGYQFIF